METNCTCDGLRLLHGAWWWRATSAFSITKEEAVAEAEVATEVATKAQAEAHTKASAQA
jgi:hypothetical protein